MAHVVLIGTLDTKGDEIAWVAQRLIAADCSVSILDAGIMADGIAPANVEFISAREVTSASGVDLDELRSRADRGHSLTVMAECIAKATLSLFNAGKLHAVLALGGSGGSSVVAPALQALPVGVPKLLVSTMASGDVRPYVGASDVTLMYSVVDVAGINSVSEAVLDNAATATAAMALNYEQRRPTTEHKPTVAITMFGVTTPAANEARARLEDLGFEVLVFHATGTGGRAMESLAASGFLDGVVDLTTTELADELLGGVLSAGPDRLTAAGANGVPQVVSLGALDMVNFGPSDTVPERFAGRNVLVHNPSVTLMRTTKEEMTELGTHIAGKLSQSQGPTVLAIPRGGVSSVDVPGEAFYDPDADAALFDAVTAGLADSNVSVVAIDGPINEPGFGRLLADTLHTLITQGEE